MTTFKKACDAANALSQRHRHEKWFVACGVSRVDPLSPRDFQIILYAKKGKKDPKIVEYDGVPVVTRRTGGIVPATRT